MVGKLGYLFLVSSIEVFKPYGFTKMRMGSTGDQNLLDKETRPAIIVNLL
jgi:hypothetical protein